MSDTKKVASGGASLPPQEPENPGPPVVGIASGAPPPTDRYEETGGGGRGRRLPVVPSATPAPTSQTIRLDPPLLGASHDTETERRLQTASTDLFSFVSLPSGDTDTPWPSGVIWCDGMGFLLNPTVTAIQHLDHAGTNPDEIGYVVVTQSNETIAEGLVKIILKRKRIKVIANTDVFERIVGEANLLLQGESDVAEWIDPLVLNGLLTVELAGGDKVLFKTDPQGALTVTLGNKSLCTKALAGIKPFETERVAPRNLLEEPESLKNYFKTVSLFSHLDERDLQRIMREGNIVEFSPGQTVLNKGDEADACYVILNGSADIIQDDKVVWTFHSRDFFGEVGLQSGSPRSATVKAKSRLVCLKIGAPLYNEIVFHPLRGTTRFNSIKYAIEEFFKKTAPEVHLSETSIETMALRAVREPYKDSIREGDVGDCAYILVDGFVEVFRGESSEPLATLGPNTLFGEMALLNPSSRRTASVRAKAGSTAEVLRIDRSLFEFILYQYPGIDREVRKTIINRRRQNREHLYTPHTVRLSDYLVSAASLPQNPAAVYDQWGGFRHLYDISFQAAGISVPELKAYARNVHILHRMLGEWLGDALLRQGVVRQVSFVPDKEIQNALYNPDSGTLFLSKSLLSRDPLAFSHQVLSLLGDVIAHNLLKNELLPDEVEMVEAARRTLEGSLDKLPPEISSPLRRSVSETEGDISSFLSRFFVLYTTAGDPLRTLVYSLGLPSELKGALGLVYDVYRRLHFFGIEITQRASAQTLVTLRRGLGRAASLPAFSPATVGAELEKVLNQIFRKFAYEDKVHLYRKIYEPEVFHELKAELLRRFGALFPNFHVQRFTDNLVEVSVYDPQSGLRVVIPCTRTKNGSKFEWKVRQGAKGPKIYRGSSPVNTILVNLQTLQFGGVKGTPENIVTVHAYLERHRAQEASVAIYDCQWPENSLSALIEEMKLNPPDVVGLSATFGSLDELEKALQLISRLDRRPVVVVGGLLSTWSHEYLLGKYPDILCVRNEGEEAMARIIEMVQRMPVDNRHRFIRDNVEELKKIPNLAFSHEGTVNKNPAEFVDVTRLPPPDRETDIERQRGANWLLNSEGRGRGCGYNICYFCTRTHGSFRLFPLERGLADFVSYMEAEVPFIVYVDEDFIQDDDLDSVRDFALGIMRTKEEHRKRYLEQHGREPVLPSFYIACRAQAIYREGDEEGNRRRLDTLRLLKQSGLVKIFLGAESGAPVQFKKTYNKDGTIAEVENAIRILREEGIQVVAGFITFDPVQTLAQLGQDLDFMLRNNLVFVDRLTEPLNPFKYFRAQAGTVIVNRLHQVGLVASDLNPDLLAYDTTYRNPLIRLITRTGDVWKDLTSRLDYSLKGIIWFAEQSEEESRRAAPFIDLFNQLKQADFAVIEAFKGEVEQVKTDEDQGVARFLDILSLLPGEKALFEVKRMFSPHADVVQRLMPYFSKKDRDPSFDLRRFLGDFLNGVFPPDFDFGNSNAEEFRGWLAEIRPDIAHNMLLADDLALLTERGNGLLREALQRRVALLKRFNESDWREYYKTHPEAVKRGKVFEKTLEESITRHETLLAEVKPLLTLEQLNHPPFKIYWKASLGDYLEYRRSDLAVAEATVIRVLRHLRDHPETKVASLDQVFLTKNGELVFLEKAAEPDLMAIARQCVVKLYINGLNAFEETPSTSARALEIYRKARDKLYPTLDDVIADLGELYRLTARSQRLETGEASLDYVDSSVDGRTEFALGKSGETFAVEGTHMASWLGIHGMEGLATPRDDRLTVARPGDFLRKVRGIWGAVLQKREGKSNQEKMNVVNSLVGFLLRCEGIGEEWADLLAEDIDRNIAPQTLYLPDEEKYHSWERENPGVAIVYLHPHIYRKIWPEIEPHLSKLVYLAQPDLFDNFQRVLSLVRNGEVSPAWANLVYEIYFNRLNPNAFLRNEDPDDVIRNYSPLSFRVMPKRTPILLLEKGDPRVRDFSTEVPEVARIRETADGSPRFVVHPQVFEEWRRTGVKPHEGIEVEWGLSFSTSSARTLYVLDEGGDYIAKTHSTIWIGPAVRRLTKDNVLHSRRISQQIAHAIDGGELPPDIRDFFAFINDESGTVIEDEAFYPDKGSVGVIHRSTQAYPPAARPDQRILIPAFALHNNAVTFSDNSAPPLLVPLLNLNAARKGQDPVSYFINDLVRPLYRIFFYFMFKQGILLEPHGQNFFLEVDLQGRMTRLVFKDWQSTMVDMETRIQRGLSAGDIAKHILGQEAGVPLSLSLVFDHYFGNYLFTHIIDALVSAYHGHTPFIPFKAALVTRLKRVFEEEVAPYRQRAGEFPDREVRHAKKPREDRSNEVYFELRGPPLFRPTSFERAILSAVDERHHRGVIDVKSSDVPKVDLVRPQSGREEQAGKLGLESPRQTARYSLTREAQQSLLAPEGATRAPKIDLEKTRLTVKRDGVWRDVRDSDPSPSGIEGGFYLVLPENFRADKNYPLAVYLHGIDSDLGEVASWADRVRKDDLITVIPFAPFRNSEGRFRWFGEKEADQKSRSLDYLREVVSEVREKLPIGKIIVGGNSQGGYMALHAMALAPDLFDAAFVVNAPFAEEYLGTVDAEPHAGHGPKGAPFGGKPVAIFHLENDQIVPGIHSERAETYFRGRGFDVTRRIHTAGQHNRLSQAMAEDVSHFLEELVGDGPTAETSLPPPEELRASLQGKQTDEALLRSLRVIGRDRIPGYEGILYETLLDPSITMQIRCSCLTALERLNFRPVFDVWEDTTLVDGFRSSGDQLATLERSIQFLTSHIAHVGWQALSDDESETFRMLVAHLPLIRYRYDQILGQSEVSLEKEVLKELVQTINYLYDTAQGLQFRLVEKLTGAKTNRPATPPTSPPRTGEDSFPIVVSKAPMRPSGSVSAGGTPAIRGALALDQRHPASSPLTAEHPAPQLRIVRDDTEPPRLGNVQKTLLLMLDDPPLRGIVAKRFLGGVTPRDCLALGERLLKKDPAISELLRGQTGKVRARAAVMAGLYLLGGRKVTPDTLEVILTKCGVRAGNRATGLSRNPAHPLFFSSVPTPLGGSILTLVR